MSDFKIPMDFMDNYIFKARPEFAMVYLYIYRLTAEGREIPAPEKIAQSLRIGKECVTAAFNYWKGKGISLNGVIPPGFDKSGYSPAEISSDSEFAFICESVSAALGKILSTSDCQTLFWIYDYLGFSPSLILMMVNYAVGENKGKMRYIEKLAISWADKGLFTPEAAEKHMTDVTAYRSYERKIKTKLGVTGREFTPSEKQIIRTWEKELKPTAQELVSALEICVARTGKLSLKYINGILVKWRSPEKKPETQQNSKYGNFKNRSDIDYDKIEREAMRRRINSGNK